MTRPESEVERARRLAEVWRASAPSNEEIERLRARFAARPARRRRSRSRMLVVALVQGFMLGGATLAAAAWIAGRTLPAFEHRSAQAPALEQEARSAKARRGEQLSRGGAIDEKAAGEVPHAAFGEAGNEAAATAGFAVGSPGAQGEAKRAASLRATAPGSATLRARTAATHQHDEARAPAATPPESGPLVSREEPEPARAASDGPWGRVARALSESDWLRADAALVELARHGDPATRDAADLARAELWIAHGRGGAFRPTVQRLALAGYTPLIRKRAARLLDRLP